MTMEVGEKSKRDDESPTSTAASITSNDEECNSDFKNILNSTCDNKCNELQEANDPPILLLNEQQSSPTLRSDNNDKVDHLLANDDKVVVLISDKDVLQELKIPSVDRIIISNNDEVDDNKKEENKSENNPEAEDKTLKNNSSSDNSKDVLNEPVIPQQPLTFTINFDDDKEVDTAARYRNLFERYNARHKRNLSTSRVEIKNKRVTEAPVLSPNFVQRQKAPSTHSEGYFSSDQEDDTRRKADQLSRKLKQLGLKSGSKVPAVPEQRYDVAVMSHSYTERSSSRDDQVEQITVDKFAKNLVKDNTKQRFNRGNMSLDLDSPANEMYDNITRRKTAAIYNSNRMYHENGSDRDSRKEYEMSDENARADDEKFRSSTLARCKSENRYERIRNMETVTITTSTNKTNSKVFKQFDDVVQRKLSSESSEDEFGDDQDHYADMDNKFDNTRRTNLDKLEVSNFDNEDAAGSDGAVSEAGTYTIHKDYTDEEKARMDIDRVFGVGVVTEEESSEAYVHSFKMSISRDNNWISEWATQVAEHNSLPSAIGGMNVISKGLISPQSPQSPSKIPSPIHSRSRRLSRGRQEQSDSSLETESYLRAKNPTTISPSTNNDRVLVDSGGESDDDTSRSHNTPPQSLQRIGSPRRASLSDVLFSRNNVCEGRRSARNYTSSEARIRKERVAALQEPLRSPTHVLARLQLGRRNSSLDRKEYASDTPESNYTSGRSSLKNYLEGTSILPSSPVPNRVRTTAAKLTNNSPILSRKEIVSTRTSELAKVPLQAKNIGYFTCTENSPYMLRKSSSTASYGHREDFNRSRSREPTSNPVHNLHQNSPVPRRSTSIQRSASNASVRNPQLTNLLARRSSFSNNNNNLNDRTPAAAIAGKFNAPASDSSSEAGDKPMQKSPLPPVSSGIKLNRAFSIRRARLNCEYETTPTSTPEERRRKAQVGEPRVGQVSSSSRQNSTHHRGRSAGNTILGSKENFKRTEPTKPRAPSISRTDSGRISTRAPKSVNHVQHLRQNQKPTKEAHKKPGRSNSTLTSKEVEFQNWKRRKNYDPMKAAAQGKKKLDTSKKQHSVEDSARGCESSVLRSASFHGTGGTLSLAADWSDNENDFTDSTEYIRPPPPSSPQLGSDSDFETSSYLRTTENVVSAMSARMIVRHPPPVDSGGESDEDTSRSLHRPVHRGSLHLSRGSDTESSDEPRQIKVQSPVANLNHVKIAPSLRKTRTETRDKKVTPALTKPRSSPRDSRGNVDTNRVVARTDSGRFSTRGPKNANAVGQSKSKDAKKSVAPSSKEVEMQNWKRRKSYDPMKAAMEGRRKVTQTKRIPNINLSPSHVLRSQSFHGSVGLGVSDWSDEELTVSADEASLY